MRIGHATCWILSFSVMLGCVRTSDQIPEGLPASLSVESPADQSAWNVTTFPPIRGVARTIRPLKRVALVLQRSGREFWTGREWSSRPVELALRLAPGPGAGETAFSLESRLPERSDLLQGPYWLLIRTYDAGATDWHQSLLVRVDIDRTKPIALITWPLPPVAGGGEGHAVPDAAYVSATGEFPAISGEARDSQSGLDRVEVAVKRLRDGSWWTGRTWAQAYAATCTLRTTAWTCSHNFPGGIHIQSGRYQVQALAHDRAGNKGAIVLYIEIKVPEA